MKTYRIFTLPAAFLLLLTLLLLPLQAQSSGEPDPVPPFENTEGMTVSLIYFYIDGEGEEQIAGKAERAIIPAGIAAVTVELQKTYLPEGYQLKDPKDHPLTEDTLEVKIPVEVSSDPAEPQNPTEPEEPAEPTEKPTEQPTEKPTEKPDQPVQKPAEKPQKPPQKPQGKPDPTNPQTGDAANISLWMLSLLSSASILVWLMGKRKSMR